MRTTMSVILAAFLIAGPTALAFFSGGFFDEPRHIAGIVTAALLAASAVVARHPLPRSTAARLALAGLAALALWTVLSTGWAPLSMRAQADAERVVLYVVYFAAAIALLGPAAVRRWVEPGAAAGTLLVVGYGLSARLVPSLIQLEQSRSAEGRLEQPLTYWNAVGCLAAVGMVLVLRLAADHSRPAWTRTAASAAAPLLGVGLYLSFSRGALFACAAGVVTLLVTAPSAGAQARVAATLLIPSAFASVLAATLSKVESLPAGQTGSAGQGALMLAGLVALSALAAFACSKITVETGTEPPRRIARLRGRWVALILVVALAGGLAGIAALDGSPEARTAGKPTSASRFGSVETVRYAFWGVALEEWRDHPLRGIGSGGFAVDWRADRDGREPAVDAHSLYIETLGELGLVGTACLALFLAGVGACGAGLYRAAPASACGPIAAFLAWTVHAGLDWDWEMPALTGVALLLAATVCAAYDELPAT